MHEKVVWDILRELWNRNFISVIPGEALREVVCLISGHYDKGATTRAISSLLMADILRADYGSFKYGYLGLKILKMMGLRDDPAINITPKIETKEGNANKYLTDKTIIVETPEEVKDGKTDNAR
jgi:Cft2 family RNA processing exonuclease